MKIYLLPLNSEPVISIMKIEQLKTEEKKSLFANRMTLKKSTRGLELHKLQLRSLKFCICSVGSK